MRSIHFTRNTDIVHEQVAGFKDIHTDMHFLQYQREYIVFLLSWQQRLRYIQ